MTFSIHSGHPFEQEVLGLLARTQTDLHVSWGRVAEHNQASEVPVEERTEVTAYFGQSVIYPHTGNGK